MIKQIFTKKPRNVGRHHIEYWAKVDDELGRGEQILYKVYMVDGGYVATREFTDIPVICRNNFDELEEFIYAKHNMSHMLKKKRR